MRVTCYAVRELERADGHLVSIAVLGPQKHPLPSKQHVLMYVIIYAKAFSGLPLQHTDAHHQLDHTEEAPTNYLLNGSKIF